MYKSICRKFFISPLQISILKRNLTSTQLDEILEQHFTNGLTNYSTNENKELMQQIVNKHKIEDIKKIKTWIDRRKRKERRKKTFDQTTTREDVCVTPVMKTPLEVTPLRYDRWHHYLKDCPLEDASWVLEGIQHGYSLECHSDQLESAKRNLASSYEHPDVIQSYLNEELNYGTMCGPYKQLPFDNAHINRFGVIPKSSGKWRLITDLSYPVGKSVNDGVSVENYTVKYVGLSAAIQKILQLGRGCLLAKFDLKRAYRLLAIKESERHLLVMHWNNMYYVDLALPFGARSAPRTFTRFSNVLEWIFHTYGVIDHIQHSLDDFLVCGPPNTSICDDSLQSCFSLCQELGIAIEDSKTEGPATQISFLGFEIDTDKMEIRIPIAKLDKIREILKMWYEKGYGSKRELLSLIGSLYYCCQAVTIGRPFLSNLVKRAYSVEHLHYKVVLSEKEKNDIQWWFYLLNTWNGRSIIETNMIDSMAVKLHS